MFLSPPQLGRERYCGQPGGGTRLTGVVDRGLFLRTTAVVTAAAHRRQRAQRAQARDIVRVAQRALLGHHGEGRMAPSTSARTVVGAFVCCRGLGSCGFQWNLAGAKCCSRRSHGVASTADSGSKWPTVAQGAGASAPKDEHAQGWRRAGKPAGRGKGARGGGKSSDAAGGVKPDAGSGDAAPT